MSILYLDDVCPKVVAETIDEVNRIATERNAHIEANLIQGDRTKDVDLQREIRERIKVLDKTSSKLNRVIRNHFENITRQEFGLNKSETLT